jgi:undecaprenyl-diphosphatase
MGIIIHFMPTMDATDIRENPGASAGEKKTLLGRLIAYDLALLKTLAGISLPRSLSLLFVFLVRIGDGWIWCLVALYLWWIMPFVQFQMVVVHSLLAIGISLCLYWPIKLLVKRLRPHESVPGIIARVPPLDKYSFPSGHTMNNLAVALTLSLYIPNLFLAALLVPLALGGLRIFFGVHFLSDITGGAMLGAGSFLAAKALFAAFPM